MNKNLLASIIQLHHRREQEEKMIFSEHACFSYQSRGRKRFESFEEDFRTPFMRDRDRIIHSASFRRLKDKTQVFFLPKNDMIRTRLLHTLEVSQISRTIANILGLNENLTEAIALGHDLGHAPFGHVGERALHDLCEEWFQSHGSFLQEADFLNSDEWLTIPFRDFRHNVQSLRVIDLLENKGRGLNLSYEVRDGILNHSKWGKSLLEADKKYLPQTQEGCIVRIADRIAYVNHDLQDALRVKMVKWEEIPQDVFDVLGESHSQRINVAVIDLIEQSSEKGFITMSDRISGAIDSLYHFLYEKVYQGDVIQHQAKKATEILKKLAYFYKENPSLIEEKTQDIDYPQGTLLEHKIIDYIANMTDHYILMEFETLFPKETFC